VLKLKKDWSCILRDCNTGKDLLTFDAQQVGDTVDSAAFEGGNIASASQYATIQTETKYDYRAYQQYVIANGRQYVIASVTPSIRRKHGAGLHNRPRTVYTLTLE
jgi:hypothetical protein